jgi:hypothetical protein
VAANKPFSSVVSGALKRPFKEQVAFFRSKLGNLVPTARWDDMQRGDHDAGFMVAGAAKADLLADLAAAVDRTITEGKSLDAFRKDFRAIVERNGWHGWTGEGTKKGEAWRTRVIYQTNALSSYNAGRYAQLREGGFDLWIYRHNDSVLRPRPQHLAWNGLTLPPAHEFWRTHSPQNAFGCKCFVVGARSARGARRLGGDPDKPLPDDWNAIDPKTGAPVGIGKGWDYQPGATVSDTVRAMAQKTQQWEYTLAKAYMQGVPESVRDDLVRSYRALPSVANDTRLYAQRILEGRNPLEIPPYKTMGLLTSADVRQVEQLKGLELAGYDYALDKSTVEHVQKKHGDPKVEEKRGQRAVTAQDYARLPDLLNTPDSVEDGGQSDVGAPVLRYAKVFNGELYTAAFEVRKGRKMLALQSLWIRKSP